MMSEHTVSYKMAAQVLPHKNDAILFVGYSDPESPAGRIKATQPGENVKLNGKGQAYPLLCRTECFDFSGHATRAALVDYACRLRPHTVVLVHGDEEAMASMQATLTEALPDSRILCPRPGKTVRLA
jgi:Cft2 family RNA processing exonuclease